MGPHAGVDYLTLCRPWATLSRPKPYASDARVDFISQSGMWILSRLQDTYHGQRNARVDFIPQSRTKNLASGSVPKQADG